MNSGGFRGPRDESKVAALRKIVHVFDANSRQVRDFRIGKNLWLDFTVTMARLLNFISTSFDAASIVRAASFLQQ